METSRRVPVVALRVPLLIEKMTLLGTTWMLKLRKGAKNAWMCMARAENNYILFSWNVLLVSLKSSKLVSLNLSSKTFTLDRPFRKSSSADDRGVSDARGLGLWLCFQYLGIELSPPLYSWLQVICSLLSAGGLRFLVQL